jgi:hypothetical protein
MKHTIACHTEKCCEKPRPHPPGYIAEFVGDLDEAKIAALIVAKKHRRTVYLNWNTRRSYVVNPNGEINSHGDTRRHTETGR